MRLLTAQSIGVYNIIKEKGYYEADIDKCNYSKRIPKMYKKVTDLLQGKCPIFTCEKPINHDIITADKLRDININYIAEITTMGVSLDICPMVLMLLEVPDEVCLRTAYYEWSNNMIWEIEYNYAEPSSDPEDENLAAVSKCDFLCTNPELVLDAWQVLIPYIKKEFILDIIEDTVQAIKFSGFGYAQKWL